jgi:hypothetical protein
MLRTGVLSLLLVILALLAVEPARGYDPPKGLKWGMTYEEVVDKLKLQPKDEAIDVKKLEEPKRQNAQFFFPDKKTLQGFEVAKLEKVRILGKKADNSLAVFSDSAGLVLTQYGIRINEGNDANDLGELWSTYQRFREVLVSKYGAPTQNQITSSEIGKELPIGTNLITEWKDSTTNDAIRLIVQNRGEKALGVTMISFLNVYLEYASRAWLEDYRQRMLQNDL